MDVVILNLVGIKSVQRLTALMQHEVRYIHDVIDRTQTDSQQAVLEPFRRFFDLYTLDAHARITRTSVRCFYRHLHRQLMVVDLKVLYARLRQCDILSVCLIISIQIARYAIVRSSIRAVRRDIHLNDCIVFDVIVVGSFHANRRIGRQHNDTGVVSAHTNLIFRTDHTPTLLAAQFTFLDGKRLVAVIEHRTHGRHDDLLSRSYVGCTANDRQRFSFTDVHFGNMQMIGIRVGFTCQHFAYNQAFESALDGLYFFHCSYLETDRSQDFRYCLRIILQRNVAL